MLIKSSLSIYLECRLSSLQCSQSLTNYFFEIRNTYTWHCTT
jgi:hypothetical protein